MLGGPEIIMVIAAVFLLFGAKTIPKWARALGETKKEIDKFTEDEK